MSTKARTKRDEDRDAQRNRGYPEEPLRRKDTEQKNNVCFCHKLGLAAPMDIVLQETKSN